VGTPEGYQKSIFITSKVKKIMIHPTKFAGSTQNPKKNYRDTKSTNQNENFSKKKYV
jgi:hypothetical protein